MIWPWIIGALALCVVVSSWVGLAAIYCWMRWRTNAGENSSWAVPGRDDYEAEEVRHQMWPPRQKVRR
jgi:hypothetical protein